MTDHPQQGQLDPEIAYWLEMGEALATQDYIRAAVDHMPGNPLGMAERQIGGGVAIAIGAVENPFFNRMIGLGIAHPASPRDVDAVIDFFAEHDRTSIAISIAPQAMPGDLVRWVEGRGFPVSRRWPKLWRRLDDLPDRPPTDLRIEAIGAAQADDFATVAHAAFQFGDELKPMLPATVGRPGWTHYLGFDDSMPVAAGAMMLAGGVAWLGFGATLESHRGRGGQSAIFYRRMADAKARGCWLAVTETGPDSDDEPNQSYRNMRRLGFHVGYHRPNYVRRLPEADDP